MSGHIPQMPQPGAAGGEGGEAPMEYGDEEEEGSVDVGQALGNYNLSAETMQQIQALVQNPSFPMIRQRMV